MIILCRKEKQGRYGLEYESKHKTLTPSVDISDSCHCHGAQDYTCQEEGAEKANYDLALAFQVQLDDKVVHRLTVLPDVSPELVIVQLADIFSSTGRIYCL